MNTAYFQSTIDELTAAATRLNKYVAYVNTQVAQLESQPSPCAQLANLSVQATAILADTATKIAAKTTKATGDITAMQSKIVTELAALAPLMVAPTDLTSVLTWISTMINTFAGPRAAYIAQQTVLTTQAGLLSTAITNFSTELASAASTISSAISTAQTNSHC